MANFGLIHFDMIAHVFMQDMNYQCVKIQYINKYGYYKYFPISRDFLAYNFYYFTPKWQILDLFSLAL